MTRLIPMLAMLLSWSIAAAEVFKCTGADGGVQYRDSPCDSRVHSLRRIDGSVSPAGAAAPDVRMDKTQRLLDAMRDERQQKQLQAEEEKAEREQRQKRCNYARDYLRNMERAGRVYSLDESGKRVYLPDDAREQSLEQARENVKRWCN